jgi:hypothetical protein
LQVDGKPFPLTGGLGFNQMDEVWHRDATSPYASPAVRALVSAKSLGLGGPASTHKLPMTRFSLSLSAWLKACGLRKSD